MPLLGALAVIALEAAVLVGMNVRGWRDRLFMWTAETTDSSVGCAAIDQSVWRPRTGILRRWHDGKFDHGIGENQCSACHLAPVHHAKQGQQERADQRLLQELKVDAILEGTVARSGDRVRVIVRLDQVSPESQLWSNQYNRDIRDLLRLQDEIARAVTDEIQVKLKPQERARLASPRSVDPKAQDDYFRALLFQNKWRSRASRTF